eukprot:jgi/Mesvir1/23889/Mv10677-RA.1
MAGGAPRRSQIPLVCHGHSRPIVDIAYSPVTPDGYFLISASKDGKPMLRNGETGDWIGTFEGHKGAVWAACLDPPAMRAATASADFSACVWDALGGSVLHTFEHKHIVRTVNFSSDGARIVTGGMEKLLRIYDLAKPEAEPLVMSGASAGIRIALFHDSDKLILSAESEQRNISIWDVRTMSVVRVLETSTPVTSMEVSAQGQYITTADGGSVKFWDAKRFTLDREYKQSFNVESASLFPQINRFVMGGNDMWVRLMDFETGEELECNKGHHGPVHCARFAPDGQSYSSGSEDGTIRIWMTVVPPYQDEAEGKDGKDNDDSAKK